MSGDVPEELDYDEDRLEAPLEHTQILDPPRGTASQGDPLISALAQSFDRFFEFQKSTIYLSTSAQIRNLSGAETARDIRKYFNHFRTVTQGWPDKVRLTTLESKLVRRAERVFTSLSQSAKSTFASAVQALEQKLLGPVSS